MQIVHLLKALDFYLPFPYTFINFYGSAWKHAKRPTENEEQKGQLVPTKILAGIEVKHSSSKSLLITTCPSNFQTFLWLCNRTVAGGRACKMKMKNAGHSLVMAHPEFAEVQIDNLSKGVPLDVISFLRHSARKHAEIFSCQTFTFWVEIPTHTVV